MQTGRGGAQPHPIHGIEESPRWLAREGVFHGKIYVAKTANVEERAAAETLAEWFGKVAGVKPAIAFEPQPTADAAEPPPASGIYVGATRLAAAHNLPVSNGLGDSWLWKPVSPSTLVLLGNSPVATRIAAGDFVQQHLGVTFLMPGEHGAEWYPISGVRMPTAHSEVPVFKWRHFSGASSTPAQLAWLRNNGLGELPFQNAAANQGLKISALARSAPPPSLSGTVARIADFFRKTPFADMFLLTAADAPSAGAAADFLSPRGYYFRGNPDQTNYFYVFANRVASALWRNPPRASGAPVWDAARWGFREEGNSENFAPISPLQNVPSGKFLACVAEGKHARVPDFPLHPNLFPILVADRSQWRDPVFRRHDIATISAWRSSGVRQLGLQDFHNGRDFAVPRAFLDERIDSIRCGVQNNASLYYLKFAPDWAFDAPSLWLTARLLRHPAQNSALLLNRFFDEAYGPAAREMGAFFEILSRCWDEAGPARDQKFLHAEGVGDLISVEAQVALREALLRAEVAFDEYSERIAAVSRGRVSATPPRPLSPRAEQWRAHENARRERQQVRVRMVKLAFDVVEQFLRWHRARVSLQAASPTSVEAAQAMLRNLHVERELRSECRRFFARWNFSEINPAVQETSPILKFLEESDVQSSAIVRLLRASAGNVAKGETAWQNVFYETSQYARQMNCGALVAMESEPSSGVSLFEENFAGVVPLEAQRFPHGVKSLPGAPWRADIADCETLRVEVLPVDLDSVRGLPAAFWQRDEWRSAFPKKKSPCAALRVSGAEKAVFFRDISGVSSEVSLSAEIFVRGNLSAGTGAKLELCFFDSAGRRLPRVWFAPIFRVSAEVWQPVVLFVTPPAGAASARLFVCCNTQESNETLEFAAPSLRATAVGGGRN